MKSINLLKNNLDERDTNRFLITIALSCIVRIMLFKEILLYAFFFYSCISPKILIHKL